MAHPRGPTVPFAPLDVFLGRFTENVPNSNGMNIKRYLICDIANVAGIATRNVFRWRATDAIPLNRADDIACAYGAHPSEIWPEWFEEIA